MHVRTETFGETNNDTGVSLHARDQKEKKSADAKDDQKIISFTIRNYNKILRFFLLNRGIFIYFFRKAEIAFNSKQVYFNNNVHMMIMRREREKEKKKKKKQRSEKLHLIKRNKYKFEKIRDTC